jgi:hypothetical protein
VRPTMFEINRTAVRPPARPARILSDGSRMPVEE